MLKKTFGQIFKTTLYILITHIHTKNVRAWVSIGWAVTYISRCKVRRKIELEYGFYLMTNVLLQIKNQELMSVSVMQAGV